MGETSVPYTSAYATQMALNGDVFYLLLGNTGLYAVDVADARSPGSPVGPLPFTGEDIVVGRGFAYVASNPLPSSSVGAIQV